VKPNILALAALYVSVRERKMREKTKFIYSEATMVMSVGARLTEIHTDKALKMNKKPVKIEKDQLRWFLLLYGSIYCVVVPSLFALLKS
jgi:hypothetical protein